MKALRIINAIFWLYLWLSDVLQPVVTGGDFWAEKSKQLFQPNSEIFNHVYNLPSRIGLTIGTALIPVALLLLIDWPLRRGGRKRAPSDVNAH